nr:PREDICTED: olfactomedin-like protein 2A [Latimeria chalumnae]|eukprot:XP_006001215.1 PREDICTED: olfactomedin-like protein 2A [Latimeria chalumnae]
MMRSSSAVLCLQLCAAVFTQTTPGYKIWKPVNQSEVEEGTATVASCQCTCVVRALGPQACRKAQNGRGGPAGLYKVESLDSGSRCRCDCHAANASYNYCESEWKLEKLRNKIPDTAQIYSLVEHLLVTLRLSELQGFSANLLRVSHHMKTFAKGMKSNLTAEHLLLQDSLETLGQQSELYHNYSEAARALTKEISKLNVILRHNGFHPAFKTDKVKDAQSSRSKVTGQQEAATAPVPTSAVETTHGSDRSENTTADNWTTNVANQSAWTTETSGVMEMLTLLTKEDRGEAPSTPTPTESPAEVEQGRPELSNAGNRNSSATLCVSKAATSVKKV